MKATSPGSGCRRPNSIRGRRTGGRSRRRGNGAPVLATSGSRPRRRGAPPVPRPYRDRSESWSLGRPSFRCTPRRVVGPYPRMPPAASVTGAISSYGPIARQIPPVALGADGVDNPAFGDAGCGRCRIRVGSRGGVRRRPGSGASGEIPRFDGAVAPVGRCCRNDWTQLESRLDATRMAFAQRSPSIGQG